MHKEEPLFCTGLGKPLTGKVRVKPNGRLRAGASTLGPGGAHFLQSLAPAPMKTHLNQLVKVSPG